MFLSFGRSGNRVVVYKIGRVYHAQGLLDRQRVDLVCSLYLSDSIYLLIWFVFLAS